MSLSKCVGRCTILGLIIYLFVKGGLVLRPRETVAALSALIAALASACSGGRSSEPASPGTVDLRALTSSCSASPSRSEQRTRAAAAESPPRDARGSPG